MLSHAFVCITWFARYTAVVRLMEITEELCCIIFWVRRSQSSSGWFDSPRNHFASCQSEILPVKWVWKGTCSIPKGKLKEKCGKTKFGFCQGKLHIAWLVKDSRNLLLLGRAKAAFSFAGASKTIRKRLSFLGGCMARFLLLLCWPQAKNLSQFPVKMMNKYSQKSLARKYFWQKRNVLWPYAQAEK